MKQLAWLIIGGGPHGVHMAARLVSEGKVTADQLAIVDPSASLLARWRRCTEATGMRYLRSPAVHHLDGDPWSLRHFANGTRRRFPGRFAPPYDRPALALFNAHCDGLVQAYGLEAMHRRARATHIDVDAGGVSVSCDEGSLLHARHLVLALGASESVAWPSWVPEGDPSVAHIFASGFSFPRLAPETAVAVIGGGISAVQLALRCAEQGLAVHLISRHALRQHQFDSDPGWLGPKYMTAFSKETTLCRRRAQITAARHRGSVPPDLYQALRRAQAAARVSWHEAEVTTYEGRGEGRRLELTNGVKLQVAQVLLATGFASERPGGEMLNTLIADAGLPCSACGYPVVDTALRWHPRVHVMGALSELEIGPVARNLAGARRAAERILAA